MKTTEVLAPGLLDVMPNAELLLRIQRLRTGRDALATKIAEYREHGFGRSPDWLISSESKLKDLDAALDQVRDEGKRRIQAARERAA